MPASTRTRRSASTSAPQNVTKAERGRRVSLGTLFATSNEDFYSGPVSPANGNYMNQTEFLGLLGDPGEGNHWRVKAFVKETKTGKTVIDLVVEAEPLEQRPQR